jgi:hypothetical protein
MAKRSGSSHALRALRRGDISVRAYLRARLDLALAPLRRELTTEDFRVVARIIERRLLGDPVLGRYVEWLSKGSAPRHTIRPPRSRSGGVR